MNKKISQNNKSQMIRFYLINTVILAILLVYSALIFLSSIFYAAGGGQEEYKKLLGNATIIGVLILFIVGAISRYFARDYVKERGYRIIIDIFLQIILGVLLGAIGIFVLWLFLRYFPV